MSLLLRLKRRLASRLPIFRDYTTTPFKSLDDLSGVLLVIKALLENGTTTDVWLFPCKVIPSSEGELSIQGARVFMKAAIRYHNADPDEAVILRRWYKGKTYYGVWAPMNAGLRIKRVVKP